MSSPILERLPQAIRRYGEVAEAVTNREMKRFISDIRSRWKTPHEDDWRFEGWTEEGVFNKCVYQNAFYYHDWPVKSANPTEAEIHEQVQYKPTVDEIMNHVRKALILPPLPEKERNEIMEKIKAGLKKQAEASGLDASALRLPKDLDLLFSTVQGINEAGVPSSVASSQLISPHPPYDLDKMPYEVHLRREERVGDGKVVAALRIGGSDQHRSIYYILGEVEGRTKLTADARWEVWDLWEVEHTVYENLTEFIEAETKRIEGRDEGMGWLQDSYP